MHGDINGKGTVAILVTMAALLVGAVLFSGRPANGSSLEASTAAPPRKNLTVVQLEKTYGRLPLYFIENRGQADPRVKFYERGSGRTVWFTQEGVWFSLHRLKGGQEAAAAQAGRRRARRGLPERLHLTPPPSLGGRDLFTREVGTLAGKLLSHLPALAPRRGRDISPPRELEGKTVAFQQTPVGMRKGVKLRGLERQEYRVNYFLGNDPKQWRTDIPTYAAVVYEGAYKGIDLKFYGQGRQMEYDIVVQPGADPGQVQFRYAGVEHLEVTREGHLALHLPGGEVLLQQKPSVYQEIAGVRVAREGRFRVQQDTVQPVFGFEVAAYDASRPLVIDPVLLLYSTFLGGNSGDEGLAIAVDGSGCAYLTGATYSTDFPTLNAYQDSFQGYEDAFVTKLSADGKSLVYSTYLGGTGEDSGTAIAVDGSGCAHVTGYTYSSNFPTENAYQPSFGGGVYSDAFVTKLTQGGNALVYSTFLGGPLYDHGYGIAVDGGGSAYVTGDTRSSTFPTKNAYQDSLKGGEGVGAAFVTKFDAGGGVVYSTFLGGSNGDGGYGIAVDGSGSPYVTGTTHSTDFPIKNAYQDAPKGSPSAFITKFNPDGQSLSYSTYLGGSISDAGRCIAVDGSGCAYAGGVTASSDFPTQNAFQPHIGAPGYWDAYVTKFSPDGQSLVYSTYLGGKYDENIDILGPGLAVDSSGCAHVTGYTKSPDFPLKNAYQPINPRTLYQMAFVTKFSPAGNSVLYSTYLGAIDYGFGIATDGSGCAYVTGVTNYSDFPTKNAYQNSLQGAADAFVTKFSSTITKTPPLDLLLLD